MRVEMALDDAPRFMRSVGLEYPEQAKPIGEGFHGIALALPDGRVLTVTRDPAAAVIASRVAGKHIRGLVYVYNVHRLKDLYAIVEERALPSHRVTKTNVGQRIAAGFRLFKQSLQKSLDWHIEQYGVRSMFGEGLDLETAWELQPSILERAEEIADAKVERSSKLDARHRRIAEGFFDDLDRAANAIEKVGGRLPDVAPDNIGLVERRGKWQAVVMDLGSSLPQRKASAAAKKLPKAH